MPALPRGLDAWITFEHGPNVRAAVEHGGLEPKRRVIPGCLRRLGIETAVVDLGFV